MKIFRLIFRAIRRILPTEGIRQLRAPFFLIFGLRPFHSLRGPVTALTNKSHFLTLKLRPVRSQPLAVDHKFPSEDEIAIVVQGPVIKALDFTVETISLYRRLFPSAEVIFSTWTGEESSDLERIEKLGAHIVTSQIPPVRGIGSHNLQMISSHEGLKAAQQMGITYAIKSRSDQRFHNPYMFSALRNLVDSFPLDQKSDFQEQRIVATSFDSFAYRLYGLGDMFHFGVTSDLLLFWNGTLDHRSNSDRLWTPESSLLQVSKARLAETYFMTGYLENIGWPVKWTLSDYWSAVAQLFIIVDSAQLDLFWPKYSIQEERWKMYQFPMSHQEMDFAFWSYLRSGGWSEPRYFLDQKVSDEVLPLSYEANPRNYR